MFVKVYVSPEEKAQIETDAQKNGASSTSKYLKRKAFSDSYNRAAIVELIGYIVRLGEAESINPDVSEQLWKIAQDILDGASIEDCRRRIAEVCQLES